MTKDTDFVHGDGASIRKGSERDDDNIDIFNLTAQLWAGKKTIVLCILAFTLLGVIYISFAKEKWTSDAIVTRPTPGQIANYNAALNVLYSQYPQDKIAVPDLQAILFSRFISSASALSTELLNLEEPLDLSVKEVVAGKDDSYFISFTADTAEDAKKRLAKYIGGVNSGVVENFGTDIKRNLAIKEKELKESLSAYTKVAEEKKQQRVAVMKQALKIAQDSNEERSQLTQAEYLSDDTMHLLGTKALSAMITNESTKPLTFGEEYYNAHNALFSIKSLNVDVEQFQAFRYIMDPNLPIRRDSPKKGLTIILMILIGGIAGSAIVICRNMIAGNRTEKA